MDDPLIDYLAVGIRYAQVEREFRPDRDGLSNEDWKQRKVALRVQMLDAAFRLSTEFWSPDPPDAEGWWWYLPPKDTYPVPGWSKPHCYEVYAEGGELYLRGTARVDPEDFANDTPYAGFWFPAWVPPVPGDED